MAMTGFFYTFTRPRTAPLMSMMKYDPIGKQRIRFVYCRVYCSRFSCYSAEEGVIPRNEKEEIDDESDDDSIDREARGLIEKDDESSIASLPHIYRVTLPCALLEFGPRESSLLCRMRMNMYKHKVIIQTTAGQNTNSNHPLERVPKTLKKSVLK